MSEIDRAARAVMVTSGCGATVEGERVFCDDPRTIERMECNCREVARAAIEASDPYQLGWLAAREACAKAALPSVEDVARAICFATECQAGLCQIEGKCQDHNYGPRLRGNKPLARRILKLISDLTLAPPDPPQGNE